MTTPKYTFLLPAFKGKYLDEMLKSIKAQTYTDFKVLISDDCSPEDLRSICEPYLSDPRFSYRRNEENMGSKSLVSHWNLLVDMCDTEFLIMASDDDVYAPQYLEEIDKLTRKYPTVDLFRARVNNVNHLGKIIHVEGVSEELLLNNAFILRLYDADLIGGEATYCYRTKTLVDNGLFVDFPLAWFSDDATNILMSRNGCAITAESLFNSRSSDIQISGQWGSREDSTKKMIATLSFYKWMHEFMENRTDDRNKDEIRLRYYHKVYSNVQNYIYHCSPSNFAKFFFQCPGDIGLSKIRMCLHYVKVLVLKSCNL